MARSKKSTKAKPSARRAPPRADKKASTRDAKAKPAAAKASGKAGAETDVERRWREYWECRTALESAVEAVRDSEAQLTAARSAERERRLVFDRTKDSLRDLLEVEPASSARPPKAETASLFDSGKRLGVVDPDDRDDDDVSDDAEEG